jgi:uncharacterized protein (DUF2461 family)
MNPSDLQALEQTLERRRIYLQQHPDFIRAPTGFDWLPK